MYLLVLFLCTLVKAGRSDLAVRLTWYRSMKKLALVSPRLVLPAFLIQVQKIRIVAGWGR